MYLPPIMLLMFLMVMMSTFMSLSSSNWFFIWMSMELNMLSFIPIMLNNNKMLEVEGSVKYFITQSMASSIMLLCSIMMWYVQQEHLMFSYLILFSMLMKLGSFPCHFWFPVVMNSCEWMVCLLLTTWQKMIPISIIFSITIISNNMLMLVCIMNMLIGGVMGMKITSMKSIMSYSSMSHMGWMITLKISSMHTMMYLYFLTYVIMLMPLFLMFNKLSITNIKSMNMMNKMPYILILTMSFFMLSMSGMPPFTGFMMKMMVIYYTMSFSFQYMLVLIVISILSLYFYLNLTYNLMINSMISKNNLNFNLSGFYTLPFFIMTPLVFLFYAMTLFNKS